MKACPFCAEEIQEAAIICRHCQRDLTRTVKSRSTITNALVWAAVILAVIIVALLINEPARNQARPAASVSTKDPWVEKDWHPAGDGIEVRWINDDAFSHVGGHCYGRKTDGSTRDTNGKPGLAPLAEKFCIAAGAKDTPFDVPDKR